MTETRTTPSSIPFVDCDECRRNHPATRSHCARCGRPSAFIDPANRLCLDCSKSIYGGIQP